MNGLSKAHSVLTGKVLLDETYQLVEHIGIKPKPVLKLSSLTKGKRGSCLKISPITVLLNTELTKGTKHCIA